MIDELGQRGVADPDYLSRRLTPELLTAADLILTMTVDQRTWILDESPHLVAKTYTLDQFDAAVSRLDTECTGRELLREIKRHRGLATATGDVVDPFGTGEEATAAVAKEIEQHLQGFIPRLSRQSASSPNSYLRC